MPTGPDGNFSTTTSEFPLLLETSGGSFLDESDPAVNKRQITFQAGQGLLGILPDDETSVAITPITTALVLKSRREAAGSNFQAVFDRNRSLAQQAFGFDVVTTLPTDPTNPTGSASQKQYAMVLGGVAQAINAAATRLGMTAPDYELIQAVMEDLSDGRLDGLVDGDDVIVGDGPILPNKISLNAEINRFRNNNAAHYSSVPLVVVDENTWSQSGADPVLGCAPPPPGMVAWYPGDGNANDVQGSNHGTLQGSATFAAGMVGQAFSFDGVSGAVSVTDSPLWDFGSNEFTIDLWANFDQASGGRPLVSHNDGAGAQNKWLFWLDGGLLKFHLNTTGFVVTDIYNFAFVPDPGRWYHLAMTRTGSNYVLYIDGDPVDTDTNATAIPDAAAPLTIGGSEAFRFDGLIDEVEIFSRALVPSEIQSIYNAGSAGKCRAPANDNFANAVPVPATTPSTTNVDTTGATTEPGEPLPCGALGATVWYNWTPAISGTAVINTLGSAHPDPVLAAYTGNSLTMLTNLACDDDFLHSQQSLQAQISFPVMAGTTYHIQAGGFSSQVGNLNINIDIQQ